MLFLYNIEEKKGQKKVVKVLNVYIIERMILFLQQRNYKIIDNDMLTLDIIFRVQLIYIRRVILILYIQKFLGLFQ